MFKCILCEQSVHTRFKEHQIVCFTATLLKFNSAECDTIVRNLVDYLPSATRAWIANRYCAGCGYKNETGHAKGCPTGSDQDVWNCSLCDARGMIAANAVSVSELAIHNVRLRAAIDHATQAPACHNTSGDIHINISRETS